MCLSLCDHNTFFSFLLLLLYIQLGSLIYLFLSSWNQMYILNVASRESDKIYKIKCYNSLSIIEKDVHKFSNLRVFCSYFLLFQLYINYFEWMCFREFS